MSLFIESIRFESGVAPLLRYHQNRLERTMCEVLHISTFPKLDQYLQPPKEYQTGIVKCRVLFDHAIGDIEWIPYKCRVIETLWMVHSKSIRYDYKFSNREEIHRLATSLRDNQEILIVRNGLITDTSFTNIAFLRKGVWYTPEVPLLRGTRLAALLEQGILQSGTIKAGDIAEYEKIRLFNAMIPWSEAIEIDIKQVHEAPG